MDTAILRDMAVDLSRAEARRPLPFVPRPRLEEASIPTAGELLAAALTHAASVVPLLAMAANEATSREELADQGAAVEQLAETLRHELFSVLAMHGDLRFHKFGRVPTQE